MALNYENDSQYYNPRQAKTQSGNANGNGQAYGSGDMGGSTSIPGYQESYAPDSTPTQPTSQQNTPTTPASSTSTNRDTYAGAGTDDWIKWQLGLVNSTDDPSYWAGVMAQDPKVAAGDKSAIDYWIDRIRRGNGSGLVKSGQLSLYGGGAPGFANSTPYGNFQSPYATTLWGMLMNRANQSLQVNGKDPIIAGQTNAYRAEQTRGLRNQLDQAAEAQGPQANLSMEQRMGNEKVAQNTGSLEATLMQNELTARRQEIQNALSQMGNMLSDEQKIGLQQELGLLDAQIRQQSVTNQNNQFLDQLGLNVTDRASYWDAVRQGLIGG